MGHSQRRAVGLMYGWTALVAFTGVSLAFLSVAVSSTLFIMGTLGMVLLVRHREVEGGYATDLPSGANA
jgi:cell division protein FtsW (lipid II flippase)